MSAPKSLAGEARRLAAGDVGTQPWAQQLVASVQAASDDDLGTMVVARAVLTKATEDWAAGRALERARQAEAEREGRLRSQQQDLDRRIGQQEQRSGRSWWFLLMIVCPIGTPGLTIIGQHDSQFPIAVGIVVVFSVFVIALVVRRFVARAALRTLRAERQRLR